MKCLHAHILSHSPTPSRMPMQSVTTITGSTNDIPNPYWLTSTHYKCQLATNPELIPTPITQLEVYVLIMCLIFGNINFGSHRGSLTPKQNFLAHIASLLHPYRIFSSRGGSLTPMFQAFHLRGLTTPFLLRLTHINFIIIFFIYTTVSLILMLFFLSAPLIHQEW